MKISHRISPDDDKLENFQEKKIINPLNFHSKANKNKKTECNSIFVSFHFQLKEILSKNEKREKGKLKIENTFFLRA